MMFHMRARSLRLFMISLAITLVLVVTLGGFVLVYNSMRDMGIGPDLPAAVSLGENGLVVGNGDRYYRFSTNVLGELELLRRKADPLTLPRPIRLYIKLHALLDDMLEPS